MTVIQLNQKGFTLIELLVALTIFAIGLLGIAGLQTTSIFSNANSNVRSIEVALGEGVLEEILSWPETDSRFDTTIADQVWDLDPATAATTISLPGGGEYSALWSVTVNTPVSGISRVDVKIDGPLSASVGGAVRKSITLTGSKRVAL